MTLAEKLRAVCNKDKLGSTSPSWPQTVLHRVPVYGSRKFTALHSALQPVCELKRLPREKYRWKPERSRLRRVFTDSLGYFPCLTECWLLKSPRCVCVCVCPYVCAYVRIYVRICTYACVLYVCMYVFVYCYRRSLVRDQMRDMLSG
jgi:hypothetical protein